MSALSWLLDRYDTIRAVLAGLSFLLDDDPPGCGHRACRLRWIETGKGQCLVEEVAA